MSARFVDARAISSLDQLTAIQEQQLALAGRKYDGADRPAADRIAGDAPESEEGSFLGFCDHWRVVDGDHHLFDAWIYNVDSGTIFRADTTEVVAEIIQFGLECDDDAIAEQLGAAMVACKLLPHGDSEYARFAAILAAQAPDAP
ncbi:MAG: hypothetical protein K8W52_38865 [Deltaproteobacteria bacterium]|nr:hypothetical protein [Deltaproteobacteria bacterium]